MKFENPIMNISIFEVEDVITTSGGGEVTVPTDLENATNTANAIEGATVLNIVF